MKSWLPSLEQSSYTRPREKANRTIFDGNRLECLVGALDRHGEGAHVDAVNVAVGLTTEADNELGRSEAGLES